MKYVVISTCRGCGGPVYGPEEAKTAEVEVGWTHAPRCPWAKPGRSGK